MQLSGWVAELWCLWISKACLPKLICDIKIIKRSNLVTWMKIDALRSGQKSWTKKKALYPLISSTQQFEQLILSPNLEI